MTSKINYGETPEFQKDFKKLLKKFKSLEDDFELAKVAAIELFHIQKVNNLSTFPVQGLCTEKIQICKIKKFACKALKGRGSKSGIRVIYAFHCENYKVDFIEIYFKGEKENEDRELQTMPVNCIISS
jgi:mRNA-degrading endonuclease RelE of RelBE toxin-antitoxin system